MLNERVTYHKQELSLNGTKHLQLSGTAKKAKKIIDSINKFETESISKEEFSLVRNFLRSVRPQMEVDPLSSELF